MRVLYTLDIQDEKCKTSIVHTHIYIHTATTCVLTDKTFAFTFQDYRYYYRRRNTFISFIYSFMLNFSHLNKSSYEYLSCNLFRYFVCEQDQMTFTIVTKNTDVWTGVGFSENAKMTQTDAVLGWVDKTNGRPFVMDTWISGYNAPLLDPSQDIFNASGKIENGMTSLTFSRKRITKDNRDFSFTDDHCLYMMFPVKGGIFNSVNKKIRKHTGVPIVSSERICIKSCGIDEDEDQETSTTSSLKYYYDIQVKLVNLGDGFKAPAPGTQDFDTISNRISDNFSPILINIPGYDTITVNELRG